jgi:hypothetical protein
MGITACFATPFGSSDFDSFAASFICSGYSTNIRKSSTQICPTQFDRNFPEQQTITIY